MRALKDGKDGREADDPSRKGVVMIVKQESCDSEQ